MADIERPPSALTKRSFKTSIEIPIFINLIAINIAGSALSNIILYRTCVHSLDHSHEKCRPFLSPIRTNETQILEKDVQAYAAFVLTIKTILEYTGPAILSMFVGVWSDTYGRKPLLVWPLFGTCVSAILWVVYSMVDLGPWWYIVTVLPFSCTGGYVVLFTGAYCYVTDTSTAENTTLRMTIVDAATTLGSFLGSIASSYLILAIGNVYIILLSASFNVLAFAYTNIVIVESLGGASQDGSTRVLDFSLVREMVRECLKQRPNFGRAQIVLITMVKGITTLIMFGLSTLEYLYVRNVLDWALQEYSIYSSICTMISFFGGFIGIIIVQRLLRIGDIAFSIIATLTGAGEYVIKFFARTMSAMYMSCVVSMFKGLLGPLTRSYLSKTLPVEDIGKVFGFMCTVESLGPLISPLIYNALYSATVGSFPGMIYILSAALAVVSSIMLLVVLCFSRTTTSSPYERIVHTQADDDEVFSPVSPSSPIFSRPLNKISSNERQDDQSTHI